MGFNQHIHKETEVVLTSVPEELARVCCRMRKNPQQPCDGSCPPCRINFANYIEVETEKLIATSAWQPNGFGPDEEPSLTREDCKTILESRIRNWIAIKKWIIQERQMPSNESILLNQQVSQRIAFLEQLASIPDNIIDQSMSTQQ